ncbi:hypothetical protein TRL7639_02098 [Falsiruegeria litorea R37]|uniref:Uncharacterized protein n=1 Tax=Falsiruegeria litorea R37 TaxID=1200284 RepID=A0A1Y5SH21_9RHOB|nr:hypothetical protein TRL7639_02098 [Falsiruegeria litorea R37]
MVDHGRFFADSAVAPSPQFPICARHNAGQTLLFLSITAGEWGIIEYE